MNNLKKKAVISILGPPNDRSAYLLPMHEEQRASVGSCEDGDVLEDLVAQGPDVEVVADVLPSPHVRGTASICRQL